MEPNGGHTVELSIPSVLGYAKLVAAAAAAQADRMDFSPQRVEELRTAVSEACLNAIEHGNQQDPARRVRVTLVDQGAQLRIDVADEGQGFPKKPEPPCLEAKLARRERARGWGIFLMELLVDELNFLPGPAGGHVTRLVLHLES